MSVAVGDLGRARPKYEGSDRSSYDAGGVDIDVVAAAAGSPLLQRGPGPFEVKLRAREGGRAPIEPLPDVRFTFE